MAPTPTPTRRARDSTDLNDPLYRAMLRAREQRIEAGVLRNLRLD